MKSEKRFTKDIASLDDVFAFLKEFVDRESIDDKVEFSLNIVVEELFTNMVKYGVGSDVEIAIQVEKIEGRLHLELTDFDVEPFDPASVREVAVDDPIEKRAPGGLGLHLVKSMVDEISYEYENRDMKISVVKALEH